MNALSIAFDLAARGLPVFPCGRNKRPAISEDEGGHGFHDATLDPAAVRGLFNRRSAILIGVPTGEASGFDVLDLDYRHGAAAWEQANIGRLPETRTHETLNGGRHLLFHHAPGVRNSASKKALAPGVDVRGQGGYIIMPPSPGYRVISDAPIAHWPDWLLRLVLPPPRPAAAPPQSAAGANPAASNDRLEQIKQSALDRVRAAPEGGKHFMLRNMALLLGGIAEQAGFTDTTAIRLLLDALPSSAKDRDAAEKTAAWGLKYGRARRIDLPAEPAPKVPDPRRRETARAAFRLLRMGVPSDELLAALHEQNQLRPDPLPASAIGETALWAARQQKEGADAQ